MKVFVHFLPWIVLAIVGASNFSAGAIGAAIALVAITISTRPLRIGALDVASIAFFAAIAVQAAAWPGAIPSDWLHPVSSGWMSLVALTTVLCRRPFTLDYSRPDVSDAVAHTDAFVAANHHASLWWTGAFAVTAISGAAAILIDRRAVGTAITIAAVLCAVRASKRIASAHASRQLDAH